MLPSASRTGPAVARSAGYVISIRCGLGVPLCSTPGFMLAPAARVRNPAVTMMVMMIAVFRRFGLFSSRVELAVGCVANTVVGPVARSMLVSDWFGRMLV